MDQKKILVALDYNESAAGVAQTGLIMAGAFDAELILVHVITEPAYYALEYSPIMAYKGAYTDSISEIGKDIMQEAKRFLDDIAGKLEGSNIKTIVLEGDPENSILDYAKSANAGMIIMGSHRHHGIGRIFVNDLAVHILKHSEVPLLTIPTVN
jgi:nucleotide-binding universal stress UspA family protein